MPAKASPGVPGDLDSTGKALYRALRSAMQDRPDGPTKWEPSDHHLLSQTCRYSMRARTARDGFARNSSEMTTTGDRGQLTVHPLVKIAETAERAFVDCLKELGFSPASRHRLSIEAKKTEKSKFGLE